MIQVQPTKIPPKFSEDVEAEILAFIYDEVFAPIIKEMNKVKKTYFNSISSIDSSIRSGKIQFSQGIIKGDFNASLTKEFKKLGLKFDSRIQGYRIGLNQLPISTQVAIAQTYSAYEKLASSMIKGLNDINYKRKLEDLSFTKTYDKLLKDVDAGVTQSINKAIGLKIEMTEAQRAFVAEEYSNNLKLYIKDFIEEQVPLLRQDVEKAVFSGIRAESLQEVIIDRYGVSESKAKFLAKQEISLLTSKFKQAKYQQAGINKYKWSISNVRTRPDHRALNGKIFSFDDPPITNQETGDKNNPGEDFSCNCVPIPIIDD